MVHRDHHLRSYEVLNRQFFDGGFVHQHVLRARATNGFTIALRVCIVVKVDGDLISRIDQYFDPPTWNHY